MSAQLSNRAQVKTIISLSPGIHLRKLQKVLGASFSTTRYHVEGLERDGEIVRTKDGGYDRLYPSGTSEAMKGVYAVLQDKTARKILKALADSGELELTNGELAEKLHLPKSTLSEHVMELSKVRLVKRAFSVEGRVLYDLGDREEVVHLLSTFERNILSIATDRFIDFWDL